MTTNVIETDRLILRPFELTDVDALAEICADPDVMRFIGGGPHDKAGTEARIKRWIANYQQNDFGLLALVHKEDNCLIGFCGLIKQTVDVKECIELGYRLAKKYWNRGLATEAAMAVKSYAFNTHHMTRLISIIHEDNLASKRVAQKVGMRLAKQTLFKGVNVDIFRVESS